MYSNCCCSCSFEVEIIKTGQSCHKMYSNNIVNSQESSTILNVGTKKVWKSFEYTTYIYIYIYIDIYVVHSISFQTLYIYIYIYIYSCVYECNGIEELEDEEKRKKN